MAFANNTLFTAGQDSSIRVWNLNEQAGIFVSQVGLWCEWAESRYMQSSKGCRSVPQSATAITLRQQPTKKFAIHAALGCDGSLLLATRLSSCCSLYRTCTPHTGAIRLGLHRWQAFAGVRAQKQHSRMTSGVERVKHSLCLDALTTTCPCRSVQAQGRVSTAFVSPRQKHTADPAAASCRPS